MRHFEFEVTKEGLVDVLPVGAGSLMDYALADCLGTRPPRGAVQDGPSTFWIDRALQVLEDQLSSEDGEPFAAGNACYLQLRGGSVEARYDFDPDDSDSVDPMPVDEVLSLLRAWRAKTLSVDATASQRVPAVGPPIEPPAR